MKQILFSAILILSFANCKRELTPDESDEQKIYSVLDTFRFPSDTTLLRDKYFRGTLRGQKLCYGNFCDDWKSWDFIDYTYATQNSINSNTSLKPNDTTGYVGNQVQFGFQRWLPSFTGIYKSDNSFDIQTPELRKELFQNYTQLVETLIKPNENLPLCDSNKKDRVYPNGFTIILGLRLNSLTHNLSKDLDVNLVTERGSQEGSIFVCKRLSKIDNNKYRAVFDIKCNLYYQLPYGRTRFDQKFYGVLEGELNTVIQLPL